MILLRDTREPCEENDPPNAWFQPCIAIKGARVNLETRRTNLDTGDYSLPGLESRVAIERKAAGDLLGTLLGQHKDSNGNAVNNFDRFRAELERARSFDLFAIVIEWDLYQLFEAANGKRWTPQSVIARLHSIVVDYRYPVLWAYDRTGAEMAVGELLARVWEQHTGGAAWKRAEERGYAASIPWAPALDLARYRGPTARLGAPNGTGATTGGGACYVARSDSTQSDAPALHV